MMRKTTLFSRSAKLPAMIAAVALLDVPRQLERRRHGPRVIGGVGVDALCG